MNRLIVLMIFIGIPSGVIAAAEDICRDTQDAVRVLCLLGGKGASGLSADVIARYQLIFSSIDQDGDGYATRDEYVKQGRYLNEQSRAGIFRASDRDGDQVLSAKEYVENRIITDEAKEIFWGLQMDDNNTVDHSELAKALAHVDGVNVDAIFRQFDINEDDQWQMIEFLQVWGNLARQDSDWVDFNKAKNESSIFSSQETMDSPPSSSNR